MDERRFEAAVRALGGSVSRRRGVLAGLGVVAAALMARTEAGAAPDAQCKPNRMECRGSGECCSGHCRNGWCAPKNGRGHGKPDRNKDRGNGNGNDGGNGKPKPKPGPRCLAVGATCETGDVCCKGATCGTVDPCAGFGSAACNRRSRRGGAEPNAPAPAVCCQPAGNACTADADCCDGAICDGTTKTCVDRCAATLTAAGCSLGIKWACGPTANLNDADLSGCDLNGAIFGSAKLEKTNFAGADLTQARFTGITDGQQDFSGADLSMADFDNVFFGASNFSSANLTDATFENSSYLGYSDFTNANVTNVAWVGTTGGSTTCPDEQKTDATGGTCCGHFQSGQGPSTGCGA